MASLNGFKILKDKLIYQQFNQIAPVSKSSKNWDKFGGSSELSRLGLEYNFFQWPFLKMIFKKEGISLAIAKSSRGFKS